MASKKECCRTVKDQMPTASNNLYLVSFAKCPSLTRNTEFIYKHAMTVKIDASILSGYDLLNDTNKGTLSSWNYHTGSSVELLTICDSNNLILGWSPHLSLLVAFALSNAVNDSCQCLLHRNMLRSQTHDILVGDLVVDKHAGISWISAICFRKL